MIDHKSQKLLENCDKYDKVFSSTVKTCLIDLTNKLSNLDAMRNAHLEIFGPWLEQKGWSKWYSDWNWVKTGLTGPEFGVPPDVAVMMELGLMRGESGPFGSFIRTK